MENLKLLLANENFINSFIFALGFILIGFIFRRLNIFNETGQKFLSKLVMSLAIPCMAFDAFMCDFSFEDFKNNLFILVFSFFCFLILIIFFQLIFKKIDKDNYKLYSIMAVLGQMTLFSIPILKTLYPDNNEMLITSNMLTLSFRIYLYIYAFLVVSKTKIDKNNIKVIFKNVLFNPIMIAMFLGVIIYLLQNVMPQIDGKNIIRLDQIAPGIYKIISTLALMTTPLAMLLIGLSLGSANFKQAFTNKFAYILAFLKSLIVPLIILFTALLINKTNIFTFSQLQLVVISLCYAAPLSAVVNTYCIVYHQKEYLSSDVCLLSTLLSIISMPLLIILVHLFV